MYINSRMNDYNLNNNVDNKNSLFHKEKNKVSSINKDLSFRSFIILILLGYFGIKIFFGAFKKYPDKFYQQKFLLTVYALLIFFVFPLHQNFSIQTIALRL